MNISFNLGEFRNLKDEQPITKKQDEQFKAKSKQEHSGINYAEVIKDLEIKLAKARPKDKANYEAVLQIAKQQQSAGYGF